MNTGEHYRIDKDVLLAAVRYLRRRPHEEVDALIHAIQAETVGPLPGPAAHPKRSRAASTTATVSRHPAASAETHDTL